MSYTYQTNSGEVTVMTWNEYQRKKMKNPIRVQRKRTKGFKLPENTACVSRGTKWGNPLKLVGDMIYIDAGWRRKILDRWVYFQQGTVEDVVKYYDLLLNGEWLGDNVDMKYWNIKLNELPKMELKGKNLACFCPLDKPCHADILLKIANED